VFNTIRIGAGVFAVFAANEVNQPAIRASW